MSNKRRSRCYEWLLQPGQVSDSTLSGQRIRIRVTGRGDDLAGGGENHLHNCLVSGVNKAVAELLERLRKKLGFVSLTPLQNYYSEGGTVPFQYLSPAGMGHPP